MIAAQESETTGRQTGGKPSRTDPGKSSARCRFPFFGKLEEEAWESYYFLVRSRATIPACGFVNGISTESQDQRDRRISEREIKHRENKLVEVILTRKFSSHGRNAFVSVSLVPSPPTYTSVPRESSKTFYRPAAANRSKIFDGIPCTCHHVYPFARRRIRREITSYN